ncbi:transcriptional regulator, Sir2 family protein [Pelomyxa schiedti]|nr:transcriptional regulator, Sir2 family protein [Pelomyxa schiedti]
MAATVDATRIAERYDTDEEFEAKMVELTKMVTNSSYTVFFTGAGVSTSSGVGDYRGPSGAWTQRRINELKGKKSLGTITPAEEEDLEGLLAEQAKELAKSTKKVPMLDAEPSVTHMAMATLIRKRLAHFVVTTNLDGLYRKAGLVAHTQLACLHGDVFVQRCTGCSYDFERNFHVRQPRLYVHDHSAGPCPRCGSAPPKGYTGLMPNPKAKTGSGTGFVNNGLISTTDANMGTKDTIINFGENLDDTDWNEAETHCQKARLCIVAGTSMSLRHITHFPFLARRTVIINLQPTPDDAKAHIRIWATCDKVFTELMKRLSINIDPVPVWHPRDALPIAQIPKTVHTTYIEAAQRLSLRAILAGGIIFGNTHSVVQPESATSSTTETSASASKSSASAPRTKHKWTLYVRPSLAATTADLSVAIKSVEFTLHETFTPPIVTVDTPPFEVTRTGWGIFTTKIRIRFQPCMGVSEAALTHELNFEAPDTSAPYHFS